MAPVDVLDGKLHALELIFALHRIGAGARHGGADGHRWALRAGRPGADRRLICRVCRHEAEAARAANGKGAEPGAGRGSRAQHMAPR